MRCAPRTPLSARARSRLRRIVAAATDYIYSVRLEAGQAVESRHGQGCLALTGYSCAELEADPGLWLQMVLPEDRPLVEARARRLNAGEDCPPIEHRILRKDGDRSLGEQHGRHPPLRRRAGARLRRPGP